MLFLYGCSCSRHSRKIAESSAISSTFGLLFMGPPAAVFALHLYLYVLYFYMEVFFCSSSSLMVSSPKNSPFLTLSPLDKSISGLTDLKSPIFTRRSYLFLTAGILIFIYRDMALKDFLPSSIKNNFRIQRQCCHQGLHATRCNILNAKVI